MKFPEFGIGMAPNLKFSRPAQRFWLPGPGPWRAGYCDSAGRAVTGHGGPAADDERREPWGHIPTRQAFRPSGWSAITIQCRLD